MNDNKRIAFNTVVIFIRLCVVTLISLWVSRAVLQTLGIENYGLYNVVGGIVVVLNVFNTAMMSTTYRYLAFEVGKVESGDTNKIFNTSFIIHCGFAFLILLIGFTAGLWYVNTYLNIMPAQLPNARFVLYVSIITAAFSTLTIPFQGLQVAYEKFTINAIIDIISQIVRIIGVLLFVKSNGYGIRMYALVMLVSNVTAGILYYIYSIKNYYGVIKLKIYHDWCLIKEMIAFASWTLFGAAANVGKVQGGAIIINYYFGTAINAAYAVATQIENFILMFSRTLNNAAIPQITKNFSGGNEKRSITLTAYISKYTFLLMTFVAFPVILEMDFLLELWLGKTPNGTTQFARIMILAALLGTLGEGISAMINATGKIIAYQLVVNLILLIGLPISIICYNWGANYIAISVVYCVISGVSGFIKLYMLHRVITFNISSFFRISYLRIFIVSIPLIVFYLLYNSSGYSFWNHCLWICISELYLLLDIAILGLDTTERGLLGHLISKFSLK